MRRTETVVTVTCDECSSILKPNDKQGKVTDKDYCDKCLKMLRDLFEDEYQRVFNHMVPDRRGGYRQLGTYDG